MFNVKTYGFFYTDVSIFCVGTETQIDLLKEYYELHKYELDSQSFIDRIISHGIYAYMKPRKWYAKIKCRRFNKIFESKKLLFDIKYIEEATFIASPYKMIKAFKRDDIYNQECQTSEYLRSIFPELPRQFTIEREQSETSHD